MEADLIPGLPDCVALECLLRLPFHAIPSARTVCKRWKNEFDSPSFYRIRMAAGHAHSVASLLLRGKLSSTVDKLHLALYEPDTGVCMIRHLAANRPNHKKGCIIAVVIGRELVVIGGWDMLENHRTGDVHIYDILSGAWRLGAPKPDPEQPFFRCGLKGEKVFVISGRDAEGKKLLYDAAVDMWIEMSDLGQDTCQGISRSFCDKVWQNREEYKDAIRCFSELILNGADKVTIRTTKNEKEEEKEIVLFVPEKKSGEKATVPKVTLNKYALRMLRRQLGLRPNKVGKYLQFYSFCWL